MAQMFIIDLSKVPSHEERLSIESSFDQLGFDISEHWIPIDMFHRELDYIEAFWLYKSKPPLPNAPANVKITQL